jgi:hypothetical protein
MPPNLQDVKLKFARRRSAKVMGVLAEGEPPKEGDHVRGIMVTNLKDGTTKIVAPQDLARFTPLRLGAIKSKLHVPFAGSVDTLRLFLTEMFAGVTETSVDGGGNEDTDTLDGTGDIPAPATTTKSTTTFGLHGDKVRSIFFSYLLSKRLFIVLCGARATFDNR